MVETVGGLKIDLDLDAKDFEASLKTIDKEIDGLEKGLSDIGGKGFDKLEKEADNAAKSVKKVGDAGKKAGDEIASSAQKAMDAWRKQNEQMEKLVGGMRTLGQTLTASLTVPITGLFLGGAFGTDKIPEMEAAINRFTTSFQKFGEIAQRTLVPVIEKLAEIFESVTNWFSGLSGGTQTIILAIAGIAAATGPAILAAAALIDTWNKVKGAIAAARLMQLEFNATSMMNPWTIALVAIVGTLALLEAKNGSVSKSFATLESAGTKAFNAIEKAAAPLKQKLDDAFSSLFGDKVTEVLNNFASGGLLTGVIGLLGDTGEAAGDMGSKMGDASGGVDLLSGAVEKQQKLLDGLLTKYNEVDSAYDSYIDATTNAETAGNKKLKADDAAEKAQNDLKKALKESSPIIQKWYDDVEKGIITETQAAAAMDDVSEAAGKQIRHLFDLRDAAQVASGEAEKAAKNAATAGGEADTAKSKLEGVAGVQDNGTGTFLGMVISKLQQIQTEANTATSRLNELSSIQALYQPIQSPIPGVYYQTDQNIINMNQSMQGYNTGTVSNPQRAGTASTTQYLAQSAPPDATTVGVTLDSPFAQSGRRDSAGPSLNIDISGSNVWKSSESVGKKAAESMNKAINGTQSDVGRWVTTGFRQSESAGIVAAQTTASKIASTWNSALSTLKVPAFSFSKTTESVSSGTNPYAGMPVYYGGQGWQSSQGTTINYGDGCVVGGGGGSSITTSLPTGTNNDPVSCVLVNPGSTNSQNFNASLWCDPEFITWLDNSFQQDMANVQAGAISAGYLKGSQVAMTQGAATTVSAATYSATGEVVAATPQPAAVKTSILSDPSIVTEVAMRQVNAGNVQATTTRTTTGAVKDFGTSVAETASNLSTHVSDIISNWQTQAATFNNNMSSYWGGIMSAFGISVSGGGGGGGSSGGYSVGGSSSGGISVSNPITPGFKSLVGSPVSIIQNVNMQNSSFTPNFTPRDVMNQVAADRNLALTKLGYR